MVISNESYNDICIRIFYDDGYNQEIVTSDTYDKYCKYLINMQSDEHIQKIITSIERRKNPIVKFTDISAGDIYIDRRSYIKYKAEFEDEYQCGLDFYIAFEDKVQPKMYTILLKFKKKFSIETSPNSLAKIIIKQNTNTGDDYMNIIEIPIFGKMSNEKEYHLHWNKENALNVCVNKAKEFIDYILSTTNISTANIVSAYSDM